MVFINSRSGELKEGRLGIPQERAVLHSARQSWTGATRFMSMLVVEGPFPGGVVHMEEGDGMEEVTVPLGIAVTIMEGEEAGPTSGP